MRSVLENGHIVVALTHIEYDKTKTAPNEADFANSRIENYGRTL